jgi:hypothetical protein
MPIQVNLNEAIDNCLAVIGTLTYLNYCHNRRISPDITPEKWKLVYGDKVEEMETLYKLENKKEEITNV